MTVADEETYVSKHVIKTMNISTVIVILVIVVCSKKKAIPDKMTPATMAEESRCAGCIRFDL